MSSIQFKCAHTHTRKTHKIRVSVYSALPIPAKTDTANSRKNRYCACTTYTVSVKWARRACTSGRIRPPRADVHFAVCTELEMRCATLAAHIGTATMPSVALKRTHPTIQSTHARQSRMQTDGRPRTHQIKRMQNSARPAPLPKKLEFIL